jgi:hypothetical protein
MSTRFGNLKRHIGRKHNGVGNPIKQYIVGNSIVTPDETSPLAVLLDEIRVKPHTKYPILQPDVQQIESSDKWGDRMLELFKVRSNTNPISSPSSDHQQPFFSQRSIHDDYRNIGSDGLYDGSDLMSNQRDNTPVNYDGVTGFKVEICPNCLTTITMPIGAKDPKLEQFHKCTIAEELFTILGPEEYTLELRRKFKDAPELLFWQCKKWAETTSRDIYLMARKIEPTDKSEIQNDDTLEDHQVLPFLSKLLTESKMRASEIELFEFLRFTIDQTKAVITLKGEAGQRNSKYLLAVTTI